MQGLLAALKILHATYSLHQSSIFGFLNIEFGSYKATPNRNYNETTGILGFFRVFDARTLAQGRHSRSLGLQEFRAFRAHRFSHSSPGRECLTPRLEKDLALGLLGISG